ncbi:nucleoside monophosphate kinase [candidate division WWE3 bacterium]|nr:nucleoside monophosphate kinase [candidate division WWE3 bacterium]
MRILLIGPPASGKSTIGKLLSEYLDLPFISVGEILRNIPLADPAKREVERAIEKGELAPNDIVGGILRDKVRRIDCSRGFILDGWMRQMSDINFFDPKPDRVIFLNITDDVVIRRIAGRSAHTDEKRSDDDLTTATRRLHHYYERTLKSVEYFRKRGILLDVNAEAPIEEVFEDVLAALSLDK